jgi:hypothetical protein
MQKGDKTMIVIPTYLQMCERCGKHGHFVFPDGTKSVEFCTREDVLGELFVYLAEQKISNEEFKFLTTCIFDSQIEADEFVHPLARVACSIFNEMEGGDTTEEGASKCPYLM